MDDFKGGCHKWVSEKEYKRVKYARDYVCLNDTHEESDVDLDDERVRKAILNTAKIGEPMVAGDPNYMMSRKT